MNARQPRDVRTDFRLIAFAITVCCHSVLGGVVVEDGEVTLVLMSTVGGLSSDLMSSGSVQ
eukprot:2806737-Rhodomonas_salina.1